MAPVELIRFAGRKTQRNKRPNRARRMIALPFSRVAPYRIIAALITSPTQLLKQPDQRQSLTLWLRLVRSQQLIKHIPQRTKPRQRLVFPFVTELRCLRPYNLPDDFPRYPQFPADRLDRLALHKIRPPDFCDRLQYQHPDPGSPAFPGAILNPTFRGVPFGRRSPR